jgi:hypothetical protein
MNGISARVNGQSDYHRPVNESRAAWREEMLDQLLGQMRDRQPADQALTAPIKEAAIPGKGTYVDLYV